MQTPNRIGRLRFLFPFVGCVHTHGNALRRSWYREIIFSETVTLQRSTMGFSTPFTRAFNITVPVCLAPMAGVSGGKLAGEYQA